MSDLATVDLTPGEVKSYLNRLGLLRESITAQFEKYVDMVTTLYVGRAWLAAGSASWEEFATAHDIPVSLPREDRQMVSVALSAAGMSTRAIAVTQGVNQSQTVRDIATAEPTPGDASRITSVTGVDGKSYPRAEVVDRPQRRRPLPDAFQDLVREIEKRMESLHRLREDDRFAANRAGLHHLHHRLKVVEDDLMDIIWAINPMLDADKSEDP